MDRFDPIRDEMALWLVGGLAAASARGELGREVLRARITREDAEVPGVNPTVRDKRSVHARVNPDGSQYIVSTDGPDGYQLALTTDDPEAVRQLVVDAASATIGQQAGALRVTGTKRAAPNGGVVFLPAVLGGSRGTGWYEHEPFYERDLRTGETHYFTRHDSPERFAEIENSVPTEVGTEPMLFGEDSWREVWGLALQATTRMPLNYLPDPPYPLDETIAFFRVVNTEATDDEVELGAYASEVDFHLTRAIPLGAYQLTTQLSGVDLLVVSPREHAFSPLQAANMLIDAAVRLSDLRGAALQFTTWTLPGDQTDWVFAVGNARTRMAAIKHSPVPIRSASDAERNAADYLQAAGYTDAHVTNDGADGGVDVRGSRVVAQVKAEVVKTSRPVVQQTYGVARAEEKECAVFSLAGYTADALAWADQFGIALFEFDLTGAASPVNATAREWAWPQ